MANAQSWWRERHDQKRPESDSGGLATAERVTRGMESCARYRGQCGAYIMPDGEIIGTPDKPVLFNGRSSAAAGYTCRGSAESWRNSVAALAAGNYSMMTGVAASLAAPLIGLAGADGFGIHFYEQSSAGKTTTANVASSLYGNPDQLRLTWYGTALGLANEAAAQRRADAAG